MIPNLTEDTKRLFEKGKFLYPEADLEKIETWMELYKVASIGFTIDGFDDQIKAFPIWEKARAEINLAGAISSGTWGEISTIAILSKICKLSISSIHTSANKTPDFLAVINGYEVEVESTKASRKELQMEMSQRFGAFCQEIAAIKSAGIDAVIHIGENFQEADKDEIINFYKNNGLNKCSIDIVNRYHASIIDPIYQPGVLMSMAHQEIRPVWFRKSDDLVSQFCATAKVGDASVNQGQSRIAFQTKVQRYMDPVKQKMSKFQGTGTRPFILFLDVTNLPKAMEIYEKKSQKLLNKYDLLSCLVVFNNLLESEECGYNFVIIENEAARFPVKFIASGIVEFGKRLVASCKFAEHLPV